MDLNQKTEEIKDFQAIPGVKINNNRAFLWEEFLRKYKCDVICEIGVRNGQNFELMIRHNPKEAVAIDSWIEDGVIGRNDCRYTQEVLDEQYNNFKADMADKPFVKILRAYSFDAVKQFDDDYFDFVYIDADHTFEGCYKDIVDWYPKVKKGGVLCGHDYVAKSHRTRYGERLNFGVIEAVQKYSKENNLEPFVLKPIVWAIIKG